MENLLEALALDKSPHLKIFHKAKRDPTKLGAPDFKFKLHKAIVGHLKNKQVCEKAAVGRPVAQTSAG